MAESRADAAAAASATADPLHGKKTSSADKKSSRGKTSVLGRLASFFTRGRGDHDARGGGGSSSSGSKKHGGSASSRSRPVVVLKAKSMNDLSFPSLDGWHHADSQPELDNVDGTPLPQGVAGAVSSTKSTGDVAFGVQGAEAAVTAVTVAAPASGNDKSWSARADNTRALSQSMDALSSDTPAAGNAGAPGSLPSAGNAPLSSVSFRVAGSEEQRKSLLRSRLQRRPPSSSEEDDGLPWSPAGSLPSTPPTILLYGGSAIDSSPVGGGRLASTSSKSYMSASDSMLASARNRDSGLLSGRSSDTEEEFFRDPWRVVQTGGSRKNVSSDSDSDAEVLDLDCVSKTDALANPGARHRQLLKTKSRRPSAAQVMPKVEEKNVLELASNFGEGVSPAGPAAAAPTVASAPAAAAAAGPAEAGSLIAAAAAAAAAHRRLTAAHSVPLSESDLMAASAPTATRSRARSVSDVAADAGGAAAAVTAATAAPTLEGSSKPTLLATSRSSGDGDATSRESLQVQMPVAAASAGVAEIVTPAKPSAITAGDGSAAAVAAGHRNLTFATPNDPDAAPVSLRHVSDRPPARTIFAKSAELLHVPVKPEQQLHREPLSTGPVAPAAANAVIEHAVPQSHVALAASSHPTSEVVADEPTNGGSATALSRLTTTLAASGMDSAEQQPTGAAALAKYRQMFGSKLPMSTSVATAALITAAPTVAHAGPTKPPKPAPADDRLPLKPRPGATAAAAPLAAAAAAEVHQSPTATQRPTAAQTAAPATQLAKAAGSSDGGGTVGPASSSRDASVLVSMKEDARPAESPEQRVQPSGLDTATHPAADSKVNVAATPFRQGSQLRPPATAASQRRPIAKPDSTAAAYQPLRVDGAKHTVDGAKHAGAAAGGLASQEQLLLPKQATASVEHSGTPTQPAATSPAAAGTNTAAADSEAVGPTTAAEYKRQSVRQLVSQRASATAPSAATSGSKVAEPQLREQRATNAAAGLPSGSSYTAGNDGQAAGSAERGAHHNSAATLGASSGGSSVTTSGAAGDSTAAAAQAVLGASSQVTAVAEVNSPAMPMPIQRRSSASSPAKPGAAESTPVSAVPRPVGRAGSAMQSRGLPVAKGWPGAAAPAFAGVVPPSPAATSSGVLAPPHAAPAGTGTKLSTPADKASVAAMSKIPPAAKAAAAGPEAAAPAAAPAAATSGAAVAGGSSSGGVSRGPGVKAAVSDQLLGHQGQLTMASADAPSVGSTASAAVEKTASVKDRLRMFQQ